MKKDAIKHPFFLHAEIPVEGHRKDSGPRGQHFADLAFNLIKI